MGDLSTGWDSVEVGDLLTGWGSKEAGDLSTGWGTLEVMDVFTGLRSINMGIYQRDGIARRWPGRSIFKKVCWA